jgi:hypothetical protein
VQNNNICIEIGEDETGVSDADYTRVRSLIHHMSRADIPDLAGLLVLSLFNLFSFTICLRTPTTRAKCNCVATLANCSCTQVSSGHRTAN